jgi:hypothetical protein
VPVVPDCPASQQESADGRVFRMPSTVEFSTISPTGRSRGIAGATGFEPAASSFGDWRSDRTELRPYEVCLERRNAARSRSGRAAFALWCAYVRPSPRFGFSLAVTSMGRPTKEGMPAKPYSVCRCGSDEACHNMSAPKFGVLGSTVGQAAHLGQPPFRAGPFHQPVPFRQHRSARSDTVH